MILVSKSETIWITLAMGDASLAETTDTTTAPATADFIARQKRVLGRVPTHKCSTK